MTGKKRGEKNKDRKAAKSKKGQDKSAYIKSWPDEKLEEVFSGHESGEYELGEEDLTILRAELENRGLGPYRVDEEIDEEEQVPIGYIKIYPDTPDRNEFYRKRYANAQKAWNGSKITQKAENWFIVAKRSAESGYDVHLFFTSDGSVHGTCTCADFTQRGVRRSFPCKHIFMVLVEKKLTPRWEDAEK